MATYSYDPAKLNENGMDRMRFELGDTIFAPGELTAALCDEEYNLIISENKRWKKAKVKCLEAIVMKWAHQVDTSVDGLSYSFSDRFQRWKQMLAEEKSKANVALPTVDPRSINGREGGPPYFHEDMMTNMDGLGRRWRP